jgi:hypothetical protein
MGGTATNVTINVVVGTLPPKNALRKIDYAKFLTWFIENHPASKDLSMKEDKEFWERFR